MSESSLPKSKYQDPGREGSGPRAICFCRVDGGRVEGGAWTELSKVALAREEYCGDESLKGYQDTPSLAGCSPALLTSRQGGHSAQLGVHNK